MRAAALLIGLFAGCSPAPEPLWHRPPDQQETGGTAGTSTTPSAGGSAGESAHEEPSGGQSGAPTDPEPTSGAGGEAGSPPIEQPSHELGDPCQNSDACGGDVPVCGLLDYCTFYCDVASSSGFTPSDVAKQRCETAGGSCVYEPGLRGMCEL